MYNGDVDRETVSFGGREATTGNASAVRKLRNGGHVNKMGLDTTFAKRNCSMKDNLNMWTQTCNQEYKPDYTLKIPERGVETTDKPYRKQTTEEEGSDELNLVPVPHFIFSEGVARILQLFMGDDTIGFPIMFLDPLHSACQHVGTSNQGFPWRRLPLQLERIGEKKLVKSRDLYLPISSVRSLFAPLPSSSKILKRTLDSLKSNFASHVFRLFT